VRLQKYLARAGVASRRAAEDLIRAGRVRVDGEVVREMGVRVEAGSTVELDGRALGLAPPIWIALHKPPGYVTTRRDPGRRPTVYQLLPRRFGSLFHVGRLDQDSEGLLLLTNEGDVANRLLHPSRQVDRVYLVDVVGDVDAGALRRLQAGVVLEDGPARVHGASVVGRHRAGPGGSGTPWSRLRVLLREGRKREVRRIFEAIGHPVRRLVRERMGPIELGDLAPGDWRELTKEEVESIRAHR
jgi:23S rRNA pseudouridine2605 synthase